MSKICIACGMPMVKMEDHALGDVSKDYCRYCAREDGSMKTFEECVIGMTAFLVQTQGFDESAAKEMAIKNLTKLPAWKDKVS